MASLMALNLGIVLDGRWIFRGWNMTVAPGERISLLGPSGCGKTTFLRIVAGLLSPSEGAVSSVPSPVGYVFQEPRLIPWLTLRRNLSFVSEEDPSEVLESLGLTEAADLLPYELSGGMRQRTNLARAMLVRPNLLLLDEAFSSLDIPLKLQLLADFEKLWCSRKFTSIMVTHDPRDAILASDRVFLLGGTPTSIMRQIAIPPGKRRLFDPGIASLEADILASLGSAGPTRQ